MSGDASGHVSVGLDVNTFGQHVTEWNRAFWRLELIELRAVAAGEAPLAEVWERYRGPRRRAAILWALSGAIFGRRMSAEWTQEIEQLERCFTARVNGRGDR